MSYAEIHLPYFKQGDDLNSSTEKRSNGTIDSRKTLKNHIALLQYTIEKLEKIHDNIPNSEDVIIEGDTHHISIAAPEKIINNLLEKDLVYIDENMIDEDREDDFDDNGSSGSAIYIVQV
jgi:hypothetical protein